MDFALDPERTEDIGDIERSGENFSDGCGLISMTFAMILSRHKRILFRGKPYTPCVYQIRYVTYVSVRDHLLMAECKDIEDTRYAS